MAAVSYLNTKPLLFGLRTSPIIKEIELVEDYPAKIAQLLIEDKVDIGLIPVAATLRLPTWHLQTNYCIGCDGPVASVCLFSEVPLEQIEYVLLDYQSRTSVNLARILLLDYWQKSVTLIDATGEDYRSEIKGTTAGVVIGDRALEQRLCSKYIYDLGEAWKEHTGLPFVFAAWISNKVLPSSFVQEFNSALGEGFDHLNEIVEQAAFSAYDLKTYFTKNISYNLDEKKAEALQLFLSKIRGVAPVAVKS